MVKELVIHLGDCKTGSTAIQTCLMGKGYTLETGTIHYPARFNHIPLAHSLSAEPAMAADRDHVQERFEQLATQLDASDADWGIISAEVFEFIAPERLKEAIDRYLPHYKDRLRLISYVRPHHSKVISSFAEQIKKTGGPEKMDVLFERRRKNGNIAYHERFSKWREVFGTAFTLRPFVRDHLTDGDVVKDFLCFVTGSDAVKVFGISESNSSLSLRSLMMLKVAHVRLGQHPELSGDLLKKVRDDLGWHIAPYLSPHEPKRTERLKMHQPLADEIRVACAEDARALDTDFFSGSPMTQALEAAPKDALEKPQSLKPNDYFSPAEMGIFRGWADFLANIIAVDPQNFDLLVRTDAEEKALALAKDMAAPPKAAS